MTLPSRLRRASWGILARFSAQSVSITPASVISTLTTKPSSCQKSLMTGQTSWAGMSTTSQRWLPARSIRTLSTVGRIWLPWATTWVPRSWL